MESPFEEKQLINVVLTNLYGLHKILDPKTKQFCGYNIYHIIIMFLLLIQFTVSIVILMSFVYYWSNNTVDSIYYLGASENILFLCYKTFFVVYRSKDLWNCLSVTRFDFTSCGRQCKRILKTWRSHSIKYTCFITCVTLGGSIYYLTIPFIHGDTLTKMKNHDGSLGYYRPNILNIYLFTTDETYNTYFGIFYFVECFTTVIFLIFLNIFDTIFITLTLALLCQFQVINNAIESVIGHEHFHDHHLSSITNGEKEFAYEIDVYEDLVALIKDHQAVMIKLEEFKSIFQWPILFQIFISSSTLIIIFITPAMSMIDDEFSAHGPTSIKMIISVPMYAFQIFMMCYLCEMIHDQKDAFILALYNSNWTEMDLKCRRLILLTMKMNNAHRLKFKFTPTSNVNLEFFFKMMRVCYSICSMLVNYKKSVKQ